MESGEGQCWGASQRRLSPPLASWAGCRGRQGSSGNGSCEKTESSPEEQVELRVSGKLGEYWSRGIDRSRYSCDRREKATMEPALASLRQYSFTEMYLTGDD